MTNVELYLGLNVALYRTMTKWMDSMVKIIKTHDEYWKMVAHFIQKDGIKYT